MKHMEAKKGEVRISTDAMIALVVAEAEAREMAALPSLQEMNEAFRPSERFQKKMDKLFHRIKSKEQMRRWRRALRRTAISIAALVTVFTCAMMPVEAVREAVVTTLIEWHDEFMTVVYSSDTSNGRTLPGEIELGYIPDGFYEEELYAQDPNSLSVEYVDGFDYFFIQITQFDGMQQISLDNEYTTYYSIQFDSHDAIWGSREDGINLLTWSNNDFVYYMSSTLALNELIKIAEDIKI